jgi:hypothetical protein
MEVVETKRAEVKIIGLLNARLVGCMDGFRVSRNNSNAAYWAARQ